MATKIVAVSGRKFSGKSSLCNYIQAYLWKKLHNRDDCGDHVQVSQLSNGDLQWYEYVDSPYSGQTVLRHLDEKQFGRFQLTPEHLHAVAKVYSFADALKGLCINLLGLQPEQVWGTEEQKNTLTQFKWERLPMFVRWVNGGCQVVQDGQTSKAHVSHDAEPNFWRLFETGPTPVGIRTGPMTAREVLQVVGTDVMRRMFYNDVWVDSTIRNINKDARPVALIADMRFRGEFQAVHDAGGYVIRLKRAVYAHDTHASEVDFDGFDFRQYPRTLVIPADYDIDRKNDMAIRWLEEVVLKD